MNADGTDVDGIAIIVETPRRGVSTMQLIASIAPPGIDCIDRPAGHGDASIAPPGPTADCGLLTANCLLPTGLPALVGRINLGGAGAGLAAAAHAGQVLLGQRLRLGQLLLEALALQRAVGGAE